MRKYLNFSDSNILWAGKIPSSWEIAKVKTHVSLLNGYPFSSAHFNEDAGFPIVRIRDITSGTTKTRYSAPYDSNYVIENGDILVGMDGDFLVRWWEGGSALLNQRCCCLRPHSTIDRRFLYYFLQFPLNIINELTYYTTVKHLSSSQILDIKFPFPSLVEQYAIAEFLDRKTQQIDTLIEKKKALINLLREQRTALINRAVTKGLNPDAPMKDSGIDWLGEVPNHWSVPRIKFVAKLESGHTPSRKNPEYWKDCQIPWFTLGDVWQLRDERNIFVYETKEKVSELGIANSSARLLPKGTVILSRTASVGFSGILGKDMATTQDFVNWICFPQLMPQYLLYVLRTMQNSEFKRLIMGSTHKTIYMPDALAFKTPLPPLSEQERIVEYIKDKTSIIDRSIDKERSVINLLQEMRTSLISEVVTGKIDVRETVAA